MCPATSPPLPAAIAGPSAPIDDKALKALQAWLRAYRAGKVDFASKAALRGDIISEKFGVAPKSQVGDFTAERELQSLLEQTAELQTAPAAEAILTVAAIGLDRGKFKYTEAMVPFAVRELGERFAAKLTAAPALDHVRKIASGEEQIDKAFGAGVRAAAIRMLGARKEVAARSLCETQLRAPEQPVRLAAAEALMMVADELSLSALTGALDSETNDAVLGTIVLAVRACARKWLPTVGAVESIAAEEPKGDGAKPSAAAKEPTPRPDSVTKAAEAAARALGRTDWRADMELVKFLADLRATEATPALIGVLQRFFDHPEQVQSGALSTLLLYRTHETLVTLTGAVFPAEQPTQWREFWDREQQKLLGDERKQARPSKAGDKTAAFCGIPAQGSRILFVVDLSGSMEFAMKQLAGEDADDTKGGGTRLAFAKRQMNKVIAEIPAASRMNFITFNGRAEARVWNKDLVEANEKNKKKALEFVDGWTAVYPSPNQRDGGTNMWSGLEAALTVTTRVYGERQETTIDEIFVVSDGAPSVGEILDPIEILRLVNEANRFTKIRINTIFITSKDDRDPRELSLSPSELMRRMAEENGGRFVEFKN
jgi:HEAT repeat protein